MGGPDDNKGNKRWKILMEIGSQTKECNTQEIKEWPEISKWLI
jgi:hypothetical protein